MAQMFCGDEVPVIVADVGSSNARFGTGGEAAPKHILRTSVGVDSITNEKYYGDSALRCINSNMMDIVYPISQPTTLDSNSNSNSNSEILSHLDAPYEVNWDYMSGFLDYGLNQVIGNYSKVKKSSVKNNRKHINNDEKHESEQIDSNDCNSGKSCSDVSDPELDLNMYNLSDYSLMFTESHFNSLNQKQKLCELCFEQFDSPALYIAPNAVCSGLSMAKPTSLVIDVGASGTHVTPIVDGFALYKSVRKCPLGGSLFNSQVREYLTSVCSQAEDNLHITPINTNNSASHSPIALKPWFDVPNTIYSKRFKLNQVSASFREYHINNLTQDIKHWMSVIPYTILPPSVTVMGSDGISIVKNKEEIYADSLRLPPYELPDGTVLNQSYPLCTTGETLFLSRNNRPTLPELIKDCLLSCDTDIRKDLLNNIIVTGGGALMDGMSNRLMYELNALFCSGHKIKGQVVYKPKIVSSTLLNIEKYHSAWIGASILSICGSFQQCFISKNEYYEHGSNILLEKLS